MDASNTGLNPEQRLWQPLSFMRNRRALRGLALSLIIAAAFTAGLCARSLFSAEAGQDGMHGGGRSYHLPVNSSQLTVSLVPLVPSAKVEELIHRDDSPAQFTARSLVSADGLAALQANLAELYPFEYKVSTPLEIPDELFDFEREQYKTSALLDWFYKELDPTAFRSAGLLYVDVYDDGYNFLFGQARLGGALCIASSARMGQQEGLALKSAAQRWQHIVRHELGHTLGLEHVEDQSSVMAFGNSLAQLDTQGSSLSKADWRRLKELHPINWQEQTR